MNINIENGTKARAYEVLSGNISDNDTILAVIAAGGMKNISMSKLRDYFSGDLTALTTEDKTSIVSAINTIVNAQKNNDSRVLALENIVTFNNAGAHNAIYRGKNLGTKVTDEQWAAIKAGTFDDMYIGDYWVIGGITWRIAAFDYFYNYGDTACTTHHVTIVPDAPLYDAQMHNTSSGDWESGSANTTDGGYTGSDMYKTNLEQAKTTISNAFDSAHILKHRPLLTNAVSNGAASGWGWFDSTVELMNEVMVYGVRVWSQSNGNGYDVACSNGQLPLFAINHNLIQIRRDYWLRDICSTASFALVARAGHASNSDASSSYGVRPAFSIS